MSTKMFFFFLISASSAAQQKIICHMRCVNVFFIDITNIFQTFHVILTKKDALCIPNECLCVILTYYILLCGNSS